MCLMGKCELDVLHFGTGIFTVDNHSALRIASQSKFLVGAAGSLSGDVV